jgi:hypothetical protein
MSEVSDKIFNNIGIHVKLLDDEDYMILKETLSRIGVSPKGKKVLYQSCHLIHKNDVYLIAHFKELFGLDGLPTNTTEEDLQRRNAIVCLLEEWELLEIVDKEKVKNKMPINGLKIVKYNEKESWELIPKFNPGTLRKFFNS